MTHDVMYKGCRSYVLPGGVERILNIQTETLRKNFSEGLNAPVVGIREGKASDKVLVVRHAEVLSYHLPSGTTSCCLEHTQDDPLADTAGRGVVYIRTTCPIRVWVDSDVEDAWRPGPEIHDELMERTR